MIFLIRNAKMISTNELKKCMANASVLSIVIGKFSY